MERGKLQEQAQPGPLSKQTGRCAKERPLPPEGMAAGEDLLLTKWIALEGTLILAKERGEALERRFSPSFLRTAREFDRYLPVEKERRVAAEQGATALYEVTEGGIYGALWELAEASGVGLDVDLKAIPIRQETIEICEQFALNPYRLRSCGALLIAAKEGAFLIRALEEAGIPARIIGRVTKGPARILRNGLEAQYLTRPQPDEMDKVFPQFASRN